jgi:hypothetical protein
MALEMNAIVVMKSMAKNLEVEGPLSYFDGEMSAYNPDSKREEPVSCSMSVRSTAKNISASDQLIIVSAYFYR